jgi:phage portal protein BeeE
MYILRENLTLSDQKKTIEDIQDTLKGSHNAGKSMITGAVKDVKTIGTPNSNLDDIEKRRYATEKICAGLGVPRSILGYIEGVNYSNGDVQLKKFIENTIQPLERVLEKIFTALSQDFS